jgi:raffinose/stachyose/melibiose transport system substrate-binding protein
MKLNFKSLLLVLLVFTLMASIIACGSSTATTPTTSSAAASVATAAAATEVPKAAPVTLSMGMPAVWVDYGGFKSILGKYKTDSGNTVEVQAVDDKQFDQLMMAKLASGDPWDLTARYSGNVNMRQYNAPVNFADLSNEPWVARLTQVLSDDMKFDDGKIYGVPFDGSGTIGFLYNKKVFADLNLQVPKTPAEFVTVCEAIKKAGKTPIEMAAKDGWPAQQILSAESGNVLKASGDAINKQLNENTIRWDEVPGFVAMLKKYEGYIKAGYFNKDMATTTYEMSLKAIADGTAAITIQGNWVDDQLMTKYPDLQYGMFAAPADDGQLIARCTMPDSIYIAKKSKNVDTAKAFINYFASVDVQTSFFAKKPSIAGFKDITVAKLTPCLSDLMPLIQGGHVITSMPTDYVIPYGPDWDAVMQAFLLGKTDADQTAKIYSDTMIKLGRQAGVKGF